MGAGRALQVEEGDLACLVSVQDEVSPGQGEGHHRTVHWQTPDLVSRGEVPHSHRHVQTAGHQEVPTDGQPSHPAAVAAAGVHPTQPTSRAGAVDHDLLVSLPSCRHPAALNTQALHVVSVVLRQVYRTTCVGVPGPEGSVQAGGVDHPGVKGGDTLPPVLVALQQSEIKFSTPFQKELKFQPKKVTNFLCN